MSIEVHVRVRPEVPHNAWATADTVLYNTLQPNTRYVFNKVHAAHASNRSIFRGVEPLLHAAFDGKHLTIMAYGQTGSGKTHSMLGTREDDGVVPRAARLLMHLVSTHPETSLAVSFTEIYNETVKDLLDPSRGGGDLVLQDAPDGTVRYDKKVVHLDSMEHFFQLQHLTEQQRQYGVTDLNAHSSRSHTMITFEIRQAVGDASAGGFAVRSLVHLVDLAGSECASRANTEGQTLREGGFINKSLLALGNVVDALVEKRSHIPYRDAKLTRLLRSCFGGSGMTFILCCVHPSRENVEQTTASLRFTQRAMKMKGDPVVVLPIPPLFTHQYAKSAQLLCDKAAESAKAAYESGLRDSYLYCSDTLNGIVSALHSQTADSLHALAGMQRFLVANDHSHVIDEIGQLYTQVHIASRTQQVAIEELEQEQQRLVQFKADVSHLQAKVQASAEEARCRQEAADVDLANWEHRLHDAQQQHVSVEALFVQQEMNERAKIFYEWLVCVERIASTFVGPLTAAMCGENHRGKASGNVSNLSAYLEQLVGEPFALGADWRTETTWRVQLQEIVARERRALLDLEAAQEMLHEDVAKSRSQKSEEELKGSQTPPPGVSDHLYPEYPTLTQLDERIEELERQEQSLHRQLRYNTRRFSVRRLCSSLTPPLGEQDAKEVEEVSASESMEGTTPLARRGWLGSRRNESQSPIVRRRHRRRRLEPPHVSRVTVPVLSNATQPEMGTTPRRPPTGSTTPGGRKKMAGAAACVATGLCYRTSSPSPLPASHPIRRGQEKQAPAPAQRRGWGESSKRSATPTGIPSAVGLQYSSRRTDYADGVQNALLMLGNLKAYLTQPSSSQGSALLEGVLASPAPRAAGVQRCASRSPSPDDSTKRKNGMSPSDNSKTLYELYATRTQNAESTTADDSPLLVVSRGRRGAGVTASGGVHTPQRPSPLIRKENVAARTAGLLDKAREQHRLQQRDAADEGELDASVRALWSRQANTE